MSERRFEPIRARTWVEVLPFRVRFPKSDIQVSLLVPIGFGMLAGILAAMMGVGGGFIMLPLMLYVLRMRIHVAAGTSLFQILCTCMLVTVLQVHAKPHGGLRARLPARHRHDDRRDGRDQGRAADAGRPAQDPAGPYHPPRGLPDRVEPLQNAHDLPLARCG